MFRWRACDDVIIYITNMLRRTFVPTVAFWETFYSKSIDLVIITEKNNFLGMF